ncbi:thioredoxin domain-containing protein 3 isoform X1 [Manacus candei]|uniref:thioredoxin domain-containing protein 3 isoform X1 n=2 Tax=Manacus candei TaxID=415023 RepID=UPI002226D6E8|nr:thioredoxin domain-containing protein 3 isoform X1 [Manacus candei]XP_051624546.1 thioredoxin domain-containing protein 3 isoform X1 [Manacus candei]XP_051624547.1 thioredoxin domain-containing protein 3 isoform X1 [Manacus candei]XP_051624548.1 thioredoxin domain-containing protein 3 isoform X1 [Manacus candei]
MASKKKEVPLQIIITNQDQWDEMLQTNGIVVIDVYQAWCGPCKAVMNVLRKLKNDFSEDNVLHFAVAEADSIETLKPFRKNCEPVFLFCVNGKIIDIVRGVNAPLIIKKVTDLVEEERQIAAGEKERTEVVELVFLEEESSEETIEETAEEEEILRYSVGIIKPNDVLEGRVEEIKKKIKDAGFTIKAAEEKVLTEEQIRVFYARNKDQPDFEEFVQFMMSGPCHVLVFTKKKDTAAIPHWKELHETHDSMSDTSESESGLALVEAESLVNLCDVQDSIEDASRQLGFFFPNFHIHQTEQQAEKTLAIIRPTLLKERRDSIIQRIKDDGFKIAMQKEIILSEEQVRTFYSEHVNEDYFPVLLEQMTSGPTLVLALTRENAVSHWRSLLGPKTLEEACKENPDSLRAQYAVDNVPINQLHGSSTPDDAQKELEFFFPQEQTFALIKPEAVKTHKDDIMKQVKEAGFSISKIKEEALTREMAAQFYKDHEGKPFYEQLVSCMTEGPSVIMVLSKENAVEEWRKLMGPADPEEAKKICPQSIRAQFAHDILSNAVHGSSNREHALKSIEFAFGEIGTH